MNVLNNPGPSDFYTNDWNSGKLLSGLDTAAAVKEIAELKADYATRIEPYNTQAYIDLKTGPQNTATDYSQLFGTIGNLGSRMAGKLLDRGDGSFGNPFSGDRDAGTRGWIDFTGVGDPNFATSAGRLLGPTDAIDWGF